MPEINPIIRNFDACVDFDVLHEAEWVVLWQSYNIGVAVSHCETDGFTLSEMVDALAADKRWAKRGLSKGNLSKFHSLAKWGSYPALKREIAKAGLAPSVRAALTVVGKPEGSGKGASKPAVKRSGSIDLARAVKDGVITKAQAAALAKYMA